MHFKIITSGWNCEGAWGLTLGSIDGQSYQDWECHVVDDHSDPPQPRDIRDFCMARGPRWKFTLQSEQRGAVRNQYEGIRAMDPSDEDVIVFIDLDGDQLAHPDVLQHLIEYYEGDTLMTYGSYRPVPDPGGPVPVSPYPQRVVAEGSYRKSTQLEGTRYNHLRTAKWKLLKHLPESYFRWPDGTWMFTAADLIVMMGCLELAGGRYKCIEETLVLYNAEQPHPDNVRTPAETVRCSDYTFSLPPLKRLEL